MGRIDFGSIAASLRPEVVVPQWLPHGKRRSGNEWLSLNPTRADKRVKSFSVNLKTGKWADFATQDRGGDLISLYAYLFCGGNQGEAARQLAESHGIDTHAEYSRNPHAKITVIDDEKPVGVFPVPTGTPAPEFEHEKMGVPDDIYPYFLPTGELFCYVCRWDRRAGKIVLPLSWARDRSGEFGWHFIGPRDEVRRPLFGVMELEENPDADVVVVEGEKTKRAASEFFGDSAVVVSPMGGTNNFHKADLRPLRGRKVVLWPDFDDKHYKDPHPKAGERKPMHEQPGVSGMLVLARELAGSVADLKMVGYEFGQFADGWDLADALHDEWTVEDVMRYLADHIGDPFRVAGMDEPQSAPADLPPARQITPRSEALNLYSWPHMSEKGRPLNTLENTAHLCSSYGIRIRYNEVRKSLEVDIPGLNATVDNAAEVALAHVTSLAARNSLPKSDLHLYLAAIADAGAYSPVRDWILSKPWDGEKRLAALYETLHVADEHRPLRDAVVFRWMLSAVKAVMSRQGVTAHGVLVLQGAQGTGKTSWLRSLVPQDLSATLTGAMLDPSNKDTVITALSYWLVELGELDGVMRKIDIARVKAFVTQGHDQLRRPFARVDSAYPRRTVFLGSVNASRYLTDDTGNRRWWTVPVKGVEYEHTLDMQQVWAEVAEALVEGEQWWLTPQEQALLEQVNTAHQAVDPLEELILGRYEWETDMREYTGRQMTATDVLIDIGVMQPNRAQATHVAELLRRIAGAPKQKGGQATYLIPRRRGSGGAHDPSLPM